MANAIEIDLREPNVLDFQNKDFGHFLSFLKRNQYRPYIWEIIITQEAPDAAAEIYVGFTNAFNGESTAAYLYVIGANAQDKAAGTGAQKLNIFGINEDGDPAVEDFTLHATAATEKATTNKWKRFMGAVISQAGSGGIGAGNILITDTGQGNTYGTITAGQKGTIGARVWVPANYNAFIAALYGGFKAANVADGEAVTGQGIIAEPIYVNSTVTRLEAETYWIPVTTVGMQNLNVSPIVVEGANTYYISLKHVTKADDDNQTPVYRLVIIMYGTTNTLRGLP